MITLKTSIFLRNHFLGDQNLCGFSYNFPLSLIKPFCMTAIVLSDFDRLLGTNPAKEIRTLTQRVLTKHPKEVAEYIERIRVQLSPVLALVPKIYAEGKSALKEDTLSANAAEITRALALLNLIFLRQAVAEGKSLEENVDMVLEWAKQTDDDKDRSILLNSLRQEVIENRNVEGLITHLQEVLEWAKQVDDEVEAAKALAYFYEDFEEEELMGSLKKIMKVQLAPLFFQL